MVKKGKKSGSSSKKGDSKITEIKEPVFSIEEPRTEGDTNKNEKKVLTQGEKKLLRELEKQKRDEEEEKRIKALHDSTKVERKSKSENKKFKIDVKSTTKNIEVEKPTEDDTSYTKLYNKGLAKFAQSTSKVEKGVADVTLTDERNESEYSSLSRNNSPKRAKQSNDNNSEKDHEKRKRTTSRERKNEWSPTRSYQDFGWDKSDNWRSGSKYSSNQNYQDRNPRKFDKYDKSQQRTPYRKDKYDNDITDEHFKDFCSKLDKHIKKSDKIKEISGDLFTAPKEFSLGHCVAEDFSMGAGIALQFRKEFKGIAELLEQNVKTGDVAVLENKGRYIYYLVTKRNSYGKPTLQSLWMSLIEMKKHMSQNNVKKLAIPQIGCGLDRLDWGHVTQMLEYVFQDVDVEIHVYSLDYGQTLPDSQSTSKPKKAYKTHAAYPLIDIEFGTGLIYFGTVDSHVTDELNSLETKYPGVIKHYKTETKNVGEVLRFENRGKDVIYGFIWKRNNNDKFSFQDLERCCINLRKFNSKDQYMYFGFDAPITYDLDLDKLLNVMQSILNDTVIYVCWPEKIRSRMPNYNNDKHSY